MSLSSPLLRALLAITTALGLTTLTACMAASPITRPLMTAPAPSVVPDGGMAKSEPSRGIVGAGVIGHPFALGGGGSAFGSYRVLPWLEVGGAGWGQVAVYGGGGGGAIFGRARLDINDALVVGLELGLDGMGNAFFDGASVSGSRPANSIGGGGYARIPVGVRFGDVTLYSGASLGGRVLFLLAQNATPLVVPSYAMPVGVAWDIGPIFVWGEVGVGDGGFFVFTPAPYGGGGIGMRL
jgi:hypothetical protein